MTTSVPLASEYIANDLSDEMMTIREFVEAEV